MFRYHRILYRRLLRGQSDEDLYRLRAESSQFPTLAELIEDEVGRRLRELAAASSESAAGMVLTVPSAARLR